jgi:hypothetical protein
MPIRLTPKSSLTQARLRARPDHHEVSGGSFGLLPDLVPG